MFGLINCLLLNANGQEKLKQTSSLWSVYSVRFFLIETPASFL